MSDVRDGQEEWICVNCIKMEHVEEAFLIFVEKSRLRSDLNKKKEVWIIFYVTKILHCKNVRSFFFYTYKSERYIKHVYIEQIFKIMR